MIPICLAICIDLTWILSSAYSNLAYELTNVRYKLTCYMHWNYIQYTYTHYTNWWYVSVCTRVRYALTCYMQSPATTFLMICSARTVYTSVPCESTKILYSLTNILYLFTRYTYYIHSLNFIHSISFACCTRVNEFSRRLASQWI